MPRIMDRTPWDSTCINPEWGRFCPLAELKQVPKKLYGVSWCKWVSASLGCLVGGWFGAWCGVECW